jgi:lipid A 3-O-deacylase
VIQTYRSVRGLALVFGLLAGVFLGSFLGVSPAQAQDPSFVSISFGRYDFNRQKHPGWEGGMQYRSDQKLWIFQPMAGFMHNQHGSTDIYAGISLDVFFGNRFVFRPSFAPSWYVRGAGQDLGYWLEFRSAAEFAYRFDDRSRLGVEVYHISNAHLGDKNPGEESINLVYSLPTTTIAGWFGH